MPAFGPAKTRGNEPRRIRLNLFESTQPPLPRSIMLAHRLSMGRGRALCVAVSMPDDVQPGWL